MRAPNFWQKGGLLSVLLAPAGWIWAIGAWFRARRAPQFQAKVPVICIGNLVTGGAGKTPIAMAIAQMLPGAHFLTKGYGGSEEGPTRVYPERHGFEQMGDEPLLLAQIAPTWVAKDRIAGAKAAVAAGARYIVMDDGYQDPTLVKDISILVVDGATGFGSGRCMPAGPLREPVAMGLARADAVVLVGNDRSGVEQRLSDLPIFRAHLEPEAEAQVLAGKKVIAFAGIGRPWKFFHGIEALGGKLIQAYAFPDHYPFHPAEITELMNEATAHHAFLVTTSKDVVRVPPHMRDMMGVLLMDVVWENEQALLNLLQPDHASFDIP
jgi:tetraacyldisaccharide 4'-kinase